MNPSGLGNLLKEYKRSGKTFVGVLIIILICSLITLFLFWGAFGPNRRLDQRIVLSILGLFISLPAVFGTYMLITRRGSYVALYENGLIYRRGGKEFGTRWDDIASLTESTACRIEGKNGESFDLGHNVEGFDEIADILREETLQRMLREARDRMEKGLPLRFSGLMAEGKIPLGKALPDNLVGGGTFRVDAQGISLEENGAKIAWGDVTDFGLRYGEGRRARFAFFFIEDNWRTFQMNYGALPNGHLLLALCEEMTPHLDNIEE